MRIWRSGNVLFLILIAVALFAALSYAVTQSSRSGGNDISDEDARLAASRILQFNTNLDSVIQRLRLTNQCKITQLSFEFDQDGDGIWQDADDDYHNPNAPSDLSCHIFHPSGGGVIYQAMPTEWLDGMNTGETGYGTTLFTVRTEIIDVGIDNATDDDDGELMVVHLYLNEQICRAINRLVDAPDAEGDGPDLGGGSRIDIWPYDGELVVGSSNIYGPEIDGRLSACVSSDGTPAPAGSRHYYHVLIPR